ncbi:hypothetical protein AB0I50_31510, partial [Streptomyces prunicolor]
MDRELHARLDDLQCDPYPHYTRARQTEGLTHLAELDAWLVARDADVREVLRRPEDFSSSLALRPDVLPAPAALAVLGGGFGSNCCTFRPVGPPCARSGHAVRAVRGPRCSCPAAGI